MKPIGIATDSHSGITPAVAEQMGILVLPMPFYFDGECYYEEVTLSRDAFFRRLAAGEKVSTSQPAPDAVMELWRGALEEYEQLLYFPMSSGLSGSYNTAKALSMDEAFDGRVFVVDMGRVSSPLQRSILDAMELVEQGYSASEILQLMESARDEMSIYIAVETLELLKQGGRISATTAAVGTMLNIKPVLRLGTSILETYKKCRGMKKAKQTMIEALKEDLNTRFHDAYERGEVCLLAATTADEATTGEWLEEIRAEFPGMEVLCTNLSLGIACHVGEGALGVGCSCKPKV